MLPPDIEQRKGSAKIDVTGCSAGYGRPKDAEVIVLFETPGLLPLVFAYCMKPKTGGWPGNKARNKSTRIQILQLDVQCFL